MAQYRVKNGHHIIGGKNLRVGNMFEVKNPAFPKSEDFDRFFERVGGKGVPSVDPSINPDAFQGELPPGVEDIDDVKTEKAEKANKGGRAKKADAALEVE